MPYYSTVKLKAISDRKAANRPTTTLLQVRSGMTFLAHATRSPLSNIEGGTLVKLCSWSDTAVCFFFVLVSEFKSKLPTVRCARVLAPNWHQPTIPCLEGESGLGGDVQTPLKQTCSRECPGAQYAFKVLMIHGILQFALRIAFRCVLHRCENQDIRC